MKIKILIFISIILIFSSCYVNKGQMIDGKCRPKNPNFELLKIPFKETDKLKFNKVYSLEGLKKIGIGFFSNGRIALFKNYNYEKQNYDLITPIMIESKNWNDPEYIGYWRVEDNLIKTEYFSCSNSGDYIKQHGTIVGDTIFFEKECGKGPFKSEKCFDRYVLTDLNFK